MIIEQAIISIPAKLNSTAQKMKFSIDFFSKCANLLNKSLRENFIFGAV